MPCTPRNALVGKWLKSHRNPTLLPDQECRIGIEASQSIGGEAPTPGTTVVVVAATTGGCRGHGRNNQQQVPEEHAAWAKTEKYKAQMKTLKAEKEVLQLQWDAAIKVKEAEMVEKDMEISMLQDTIKKLTCQRDNAWVQLKMACGEEEGLD